MARIKICGLTRPCDIEYANDLRPDFIGFVFASSKRQISPEAAASLKSGLNKEIKAVGVFVNEPIENIAALCSENVIDMIQLHGDEDAAYINALRAKISNPVIRAGRVQAPADVQAALACHADYILFDTYRKGIAGGTGEAFSWDLAAGFPRPFFLAGGLSPQNLKRAIRSCSPFCVDVSSGAETDEKKDKQKMQRLIEIARSVN